MRKQVVLLFDLHCLGWDAPGDAAFEWRLRSLQRATLRLLLGLANCLEKDGGLRFGFRLFDSARYKPGTDRSGFVDFTLDAFEALENSLAGALERRRTGSPRRAADPGAAPPGQALTRALHEVLSDFQWERADVDSPVKRPRRRRGAAPAPADDSGNAVYLVAALPAAEEAAHRFAGGAAPDELPARLTAAVLSDSFRRLLCEQCRVRLHVLDTAGLQTAAEPDPLVQRAFSALAEATGGSLTRLETLLELCGPEPAAEPAPEVGPDGGKAAAEGEGLRVRWRMGPTEHTARVTVKPGAKADASSSDRTLLRLLSSPNDACIHMEVVAKMTDAVDNASHAQLATFEADVDAFSADTLLLVRLSDQPCLLRTDTARRGTLLSLGDPPTDGGAGARKDAEAVRHRLRSERPLVADMLQLWFVGPPSQSPPKHQDVWPTPSEQWPEGLNALLARSLRHRRARGSSSSSVPAAAGSAPPSGPAPVAAAAPGGLQRGHQMMARAAQMTAVRQRRGQRQQAAEQQRQTWRRQEKERRMREQQQRALRDVSGVTDTAELVGRLQAMKERCIAGQEQDVVAAVQSVINPLLLHIKAMDGVDTASHLRLMLKDHFLPDKRRVAELYGDDRARRVREYQYQVVVLLEACWVLGGDMSEEDKEQLLDLLRMTSLHGSPAAMTEFMELTMVESYQHTQPDLLLELYEELCQPPPAALLQLLSPSRAPPDSWRPPSSSRPPGSVSSLLSGSGPGSQAVLLARSAALSRQPSLLDAAKKRQIMVPKPKELSRHASHSSGSSRSMVLASAAAARGAAAAAARAGPSSGPSHRPPSGSKTGEKRSLSSGRVKRNLFESLGRSPRRSQLGATRTAVSPQRRSLNSSFVPETPAQKNRTRRRTDSGTAVVKESPEAKEADGDVGLTPRRASQRLTLTRRASFYNLEEGSRHFARARHTVLAERLQQSAPAPAAASRLPADPQHCRPLITRLFGERGRTESAESASSLAWGLDSLSPPAGTADGAEGDGPAYGGDGDGDPGGGDIDGPGDLDGGDGDGPGRVPDTPNRRVQFDLTPAKGGARSAARSRTPRSILKATPGCVSSPDLFGTPRKATPRANAKRKRLFSTTPSKAERATPPPPPGAGAEVAGPSGSGLLSSPVAGVELAEDPMERTPDRAAAHAALLGTPLKKATVVLSPLNSPHRRLMSPRRSVSVAITRLSPRRAAAAPSTPPRSGKLRTPSKSPVARFRPDLGTPSKRTLSLSPSVVRTPPRVPVKAAESSAMETVATEPKLTTPTKPDPDGESVSRPEPSTADDEPESMPSSPVISRGRSRSRSGSAPRGLRRHSPALLTAAGDGLGTPARAPQRTPARSPPRTPSRSPGRDAHQTPTRSSPRRAQTHTPPRNRDVTPAPNETETPPRPEVRTPPPTEPRTPPRTPQRTPTRSGDGSPHKSPVVKPDLQTGAELVLRSPAKDAPPRQRSVSPDIGPAGDGLGAALLARFGPSLGATSTPTITPARVGAVAAPWENTPHFSPPRMATDSGEESPVKIDITGILDLLDEPIEAPASAMSTAEFVSVMESYLENTAESTMHSVPDLCLTDIAELEAAAEGIDFGALAGQQETPVLMAETHGAPPADSLAQAVAETAMETAANEAVGSEAAETVAQSDPRVRPCYVLLSPLQWPPSTAARPGPRRTSKPPSRALRYSRSRALRHSLSEVLAARAAPLYEHGADVQVRRSASAGDQWVLSESTAAVQGESFDSSRLGDTVVSDATRNQTSLGVRESGESFVASSTGGKDNSGSRGGIGESLSMISIMTDSVWNSTASSGAAPADYDGRLAANLSCQSSGGFDQSERVDGELNHLSLSGAEDGPTADAALLEAECQSAEVPERSDRSTASRTASENETTSSTSSPERPRRRKKRTRSEVSSSGPQTEDSQREDGEDTQRGVRQLRSGRALPEDTTPPSGGQGNVSLAAGDETKRGAGAARTSADVARTYSRHKAGRRRKRARLSGSQPTSDAARSADSDRTGEESRQEKPAASRLVSEPNEDSRTSSDTGRLPATPLPETPIPRRNGSLVNVTPSKEPTDTWQVTALSARKLSPNSNRDSPSIRMRFRLTASSVSSTASQSPSRFKCLDSPDSGQEDSDAVFVNERDGMSSSDERMWSASPNASQSTPSQSKRTRLSQSPVSRSQPHNRSKKIKKRVFEPRPADSGSSVEHNSRLSNPASELGQDEAATRVKPTAGPSRRRGKLKKSRSAATSAGAGSASRTGSTEEADGATESGQRGRSDGVSRGDAAAELAARLEQVRRQTLRDLRRPGGRESPEGERSQERRVEGTPESNRQGGRESGSATPLIKDIPELAGMAASRGSEPFTPVSAKRKRLTLCDSDDESSDGPPLELKIERHDSQTRKRPNDDESSDGPPLELKIERHDSQTRKWPKEELVESFPDGLKIKKRPRYTVTSARQKLRGTPTTNGENRTLTVLENKMNANHLIAGDSRDEVRKKKSKRPRPKPLALPARAETVGADGSASSPSLTPSTRGKWKEVSYAEFSEDDEAVFQLMGEARTSPPEEPSEGHSRGGIRSRRDGQASHASHTSAPAAAGAPAEHPADLPAPVQRSPWQPHLPSSLPLRTPPRQRLTRNRVQDMGLGLDEVNALVVSPLTPLASRAAGSSNKKTFTPPTALSLINLTSSPIMAQVRPAKRVRRALHH